MVTLERQKIIKLQLPHKNVNRYLCEFVGTFLMVLIGCSTIALGWSSLFVSISFGFAVFLAIYIFQPYSGAHINPAVSIAFAINGDLEMKHLPGYVLCQILGGWCAASIVLDGATTYSVDYHEAWIIEIAITLLLMYSIYILVNKNVNLVTLAFGVGFMVGLLAFIFGSYTGASMNPARSIGPNFVTDSGNYLLYVVAPIIGAIAANFIYQPVDE